MCEHVHVCVLFMYKLLDLIMPEKCQNCKKTNESQLKKFLCWFYSFKYFRGKLLGSSSKDFFEYRLSTWCEAFPFWHALKLPKVYTLRSVFTPTEMVCRKIFWAYVTTAQDAICSLLFPIVLYAKCRLSRTWDTNQTALRSAK